MEDLKAILRDYRFIKDRAGQEEEEKEMVDLFSPFPRSVDFADDLAKLVIVRALEFADFQESLTSEIGIESKISEEQRVAWGLMVAMSQQFRQIRFDNRQKLEEECKKAIKEVERQNSKPEFIAEYLISLASTLDSSTRNSEAIVLRDAATILREEF